MGGQTQDDVEAPDACAGCDLGVVSEEPHSADTRTAQGPLSQGDRALRLLWFVRELPLHRQLRSRSATQVAFLAGPSWWQRSVHLGALPNHHVLSAFTGTAHRPFRLCSETVTRRTGCGKSARPGPRGGPWGNPGALLDY